MFIYLYVIILYLYILNKIYLFYIYITGLVSPLHCFAIAYVFPSEQQPNSVTAQPPIILDSIDSIDDITPGSELLELDRIGTIP